MRLLKPLPLLALLLPATQAFILQTDGRQYAGHIDGPQKTRGDYLISTKCYCTTDDPHNANYTLTSPLDPSSPFPAPNQTYTRAHRYLFHYYNRHADLTYALSSLCYSRPTLANPYSCTEPLWHEISGSKSNGRKLCYTYPDDSTVCMEFGVGYGEGDNLWYNMQWRDMGYKQGMRVVDAGGVCGEWCGGLEKEKGEGEWVELTDNVSRVGAQVVVYDHVDDMCFDCH